MWSDVLAIEEAQYRRWLEASRSLQVTAAMLASQEAAAKLIPARRSVGSVAVVSLTGFLSQKPSLFSVLFGGTSVEAFAREVVSALNDQSVGAVVMAVDSPGGEVFGVSEAATAIRSARGQKPLLAVADPIAASAAYWIASQADEVVGTPSSITGSIGAIATHVDESKAIEQSGLRVELITYGKHKAEGHPAVALDDDGRASLQAKVDYYGRMFEADVAKGRRISVETVRSQYGEGGTFTATTALERGLIDRVATLGEVLRMAANGYRPASMGPKADVYDPAILQLRARIAGVDIVV